MAWRNRMIAVLDPLLAPLVYPAAWLLKRIRQSGLHRFSACKRVLLEVGVFPILDHYYEPQFDNRDPKQPFSDARSLPGIDWNVAGQLEALSALAFADELADLPRGAAQPGEFGLGNDMFGPGDAEYWYQLIRAVRPARIFEIGSGNSTLLAKRAIERNRAEDPAYQCRHVCIEPYEAPWLESTGVTVVRAKVEDVGLALFAELDANDILFIDSSHVIRPQGDVLFEFLEILPTLRRGVIVHVHDIFSPRNYPRAWLEDQVKFWNEQYVLEAFLSNNPSWKIVGALNYLFHAHRDQFARVAPFATDAMEPRSFYIQKVGE